MNRAVIGRAGGIIAKSANMIRLFRARRQRPQKNFRQLVKLTALAFAQGIDDFPQRDAAILHDCAGPLATLFCEKE